MGICALEDSHLVCTACARRYPIVDGIPALIVERAEPIGRAGNVAPTDRFLLAPET